MKKRSVPLRIALIVMGVFIGLSLIAAVLYQVPAIHRRLAWRVDAVQAYARGVLHPIGAVPTAAEITPVSTLTPLRPTATHSSSPTPAPPTPTPELSPAPTATSTPMPSSVTLPSPAYELQDWNNCGPATLAEYLHFWGWKGDQFTVADVVKPLREDKNVNIDELLYFTHNNTGWLESDFRVNGSIDLLRRFIAQGIPIMIEEGMNFNEEFWPNDDRWAGHYLLLTGYDDTKKTFISQDTYISADRPVSYSDVDRYWQQFNRVYIFIYPPDMKPVVQQILGADWDVDTNRQNALDMAKTETQNDPKNAYAWFNLGSNQVWFDRYTEAAASYDMARKLGLPQRMFRYQFGPFLAYFHTARNADLLAITDYALKITPDSEENMLWRGWALYRAGQKADAVDLFTKALKLHPGYQDATYALNYARTN